MDPGWTAFDTVHPTAVPGFPDCTGLSCQMSEIPFAFNNARVIQSNYSANAINAATRPITDPMDRSIPPVIMTNATPIPMMA